METDQCKAGTGTRNLGTLALRLLNDPMQLMLGLMLGKNLISSDFREKEQTALPKMAKSKGKLTQDRVYCSDCGEVVGRADNFCSSCGKKI